MQVEIRPTVPGADLVQILRVQDGDTIVLRSEDRLSNEMGARMREGFDPLKDMLEARGIHVTVLVLDRGLSLEVLRPTEDGEEPDA